jgi:hypothetical protein
MTEVFLMRKEPGKKQLDFILFYNLLQDISTLEESC